MTTLTQNTTQQTIDDLKKELTCLNKKEYFYLVENYDPEKLFQLKFDIRVCLTKIMHAQQKLIYELENTHETYRNQSTVF